MTIDLQGFTIDVGGTTGDGITDLGIAPRMEVLGEPVIAVG